MRHIRNDLDDREQSYAIDRVADGQAALGSVQIMLFTGKDRPSMEAELRQFIGPDTVVIQEP